MQYYSCMNHMTVSASELARSTSALLDEVDRGRTVIIERRGFVVARLIPEPAGGRSLMGAMAGRGQQIADDTTLLEPVPGWDTT